MQSSHRDRRVVREIERSTWGMLGLVLALGALAVGAPLEGIRFAAVLGLAVAGGAYLWQSGRAVGDYVRDLHQVEYGETVSGRVRAEVASQVGVDGSERGPTRALPAVRRDSRRTR
ncbi:MAG TPA: hypothetical protein VEY07_01450 [Thermoplasmata archaeon]|nr:hypothetical protein [Thermoplasmata archaeon]